MDGIGVSQGESKYTFPHAAKELHDSLLASLKQERFGDRRDRSDAADLSDFMEVTFKPAFC